jgi:hypothetical protein
MSHASLLEALDTGSIWSVARGLARSAAAYKGHLMECDSPRHGDVDGRGALSEEALAAFTQFFLKTCLDQVTALSGRTVRQAPAAQSTAVARGRRAKASPEPFRTPTNRSSHDGYGRGKSAIVSRSRRGFNDAGLDRSALARIARCRS